MHHSHANFTCKTSPFMLSSFTVVWLEPRRVRIASMNSPKVKGSPSSKSNLPQQFPGLEGYGSPNQGSNCTNLQLDLLKIPTCDQRLMATHDPRSLQPRNQFPWHHRRPPPNGLRPLRPQAAPTTWWGWPLPTSCFKDHGLHHGWTLNKHV